MKRRSLIAALGTIGAAGFLPAVSRSQDNVTEIRIGYQKTGVLPVAKQQQLLEKRFAAQGIAVKWAEFPFGPPLLEALQAGSLEYGYTGDAPPIFAQAARPALLYAAVIPARGSTQAILVPPDSPLKTLQDLRGKKIGVAKGSSAHSLLVAALESENIAWSEITPVYLPPADAASAFAKGAIDAWSIWDPFYAIAELSKAGARGLPIKPEALAQSSFFLSNRAFTEKHPEIIAAINEEVGKATKWIDAHRDESARLFAEATGVSYEAQKRTIDRSDFVFGPLTEAVIVRQQATADRFFKLGLIPKQINVRDIVWSGKTGA
jgi:aliphatic sulfonates family ABC transporter substrate-binding protein